MVTAFNNYGAEENASTPFDEGAQMRRAEEKARQMWVKAKKDGFTHPYLTKKQVGIHGIGLLGDKLIIPTTAIDAKGEIVSCQTIGTELNSKSNKKLLPGGRAKGCYFVIKGSDQTFICEGYATGATIHEVTGATVIVALFVWNIPNVARHFPGAVVACDNDISGIGIDAGRKTGLKSVYPEFKDTPELKSYGKATDFNDLYALEGAEAVKRHLLGIKTRFSCRSFIDILESKKVTKPLIKGLLNEQESLMIIGPSGLGKSLLTTEIAMRAALPSNPDKPNLLFEKFEIIKPLRSLFVQSENTIAATKTRMEDMIDGCPDFFKLDEHATLFLGTDEGKDSDDIRVVGSFTDAAFRDEIIWHTKEHKRDIIIFDPLISYHGENENDNSAMRGTLDALTKIQDETGAAVILVHHVGKSGSGNSVFAGRGASAIGD